MLMLFWIKKTFSYSRKTFEINILDEEVSLELMLIPQMVQSTVNLVIYVQMCSVWLV